MNAHFTRPEAYLSHGRPQGLTPANDGDVAAETGESLQATVTLLVWLLGVVEKAMFGIYTSSMFAIIFALEIGLTSIAWLFVASTLASATTALVANFFAARLGR